MAIQVKYAETETEKEAIYRLRYEIYIKELGDQLSNEDEKLMDAGDAHARLLMAVDEDELVGTLRINWGGDGPFNPKMAEVYDLSRFSSIVTNKEIVLFDRFMVKPEYRGTHAPFQLLAAISMFSLEKKAQLAFCDCQPHLLNLYLGLGFRTYTTSFSDYGAGVLIPLVFVCEDIEHLRRIGSPLLAFEGGHMFESDVPAKVAPLIEEGNKTLESATDETVSEWVQAYGLLTQTGATKVSLFEGVSEDDVVKLLARSHIIECKEGDLIVMVGRTERTMYVLLSGSAEIRAGEEVVGIRSEGDVVGELAFLLHGRRLADVYAATDARVLALNEKVLRQFQETEPAIATQLMHNLARIVALKMVSLYQRTFS